MKPISTVIVDDVALARQKVMRALKDHPDIEVLGEAEDGPSMIAMLREKRPSLLFLDISMPEQDGFSALAVIEESARPLIVFLTAHSHFAVDAFRVDAVDYLVKPLDPVALRVALTKVRRRLGEPTATVPTPTRAATEFSQRIAFRTDEGFKVVRVDAIRWIESVRNHIAVHTESETLLTRCTLQEILEKLDPASFVRVHRSAAVNIDVVHYIQPQSSGDQKLVLDDGTELAVSRGYREELLRRCGL
jgi:two-component system, LytTR family, response regulator